jgi:hypothetical protein
VSEAELYDGLAFAERIGLLHADGEEPLRLWLDRRPKPAPATPTAPTAPATRPVACQESNPGRRAQENSTKP